jgi:hypothetical protein
MPSSLNGTGVTFNDGSTLQSGNIPAANMGSGTANSSTFLRGDRTWAAVSVPSTDFDGVGSYAVAYLAESPGITTHTRSSGRVRGYTVAGSSLRVNSRASANNIGIVATNGDPGWRFLEGTFGVITGPGNSNSFPTANSTTLSGTWRLMTSSIFATSIDSGYNSWGGTNWFPALWVRIA